jgi:hypothetical protein
MKGKPWSPTEEAILRRSWPEIRTADIAALIARSPKAIKTRAKVLRLKKKNRIYHRWTAAEDRVLRAQYPNLKTAELAKRFGATILSTYQRAHKIGARKSDEYLARKMEIEAALLRRVGMAGRFQPGHPPANKGLKRPGWSPGCMAETQFKKGRRSRNYLPVGTIRADSDGWLRRKIAEGLGGFGNGRVWEFIHRGVWEDAHGPIPKGYAVVFKDKDRTHVALDNLELVSRGELMLRNTIHNLPPALKQVIMLTGALKRKIRNREGKLNGKEHIAGPAGPPVCPTGSAERQRASAGD